LPSGVYLPSGANPAPAGAEEQLVRDHLDQIDKRLAEEGLRTITLTILATSSDTGSRTWRLTEQPAVTQADGRLRIAAVSRRSESA
jgi:hypothetical protein